MSEKQLMTRPMQEKPEAREISVIDARREVGHLTSDDFYSVGDGKKRPGAKVARAIALEEGISTEILDFGKDKEKAWGKIRASKTLENGRVIFSDKAVMQLYSHIIQKMTIDAMENGMTVIVGKWPNGGPKRGRVFPEAEPGADGFPIITDPKLQMQLMKNALTKISILERDCLGKAERNAILALVAEMNEKEHEDEEGEEEEHETPAPRPEPGEATGVVEKQKSPLEFAIDGVREEFMKHAKGNKELALALFSDIVKEAGVENVSRPSDLKSVDDAGKVIAQLKKYQASENGDFEEI